MPNEPDAKSTPPGLTEETVHEIVNSAIASRMKRAGDQIVGEVQKLLDERIPDGNAETEGKAASAPDAPQNDKRLAAVEKELSETKVKELAGRKREALRTALKSQQINSVSDFTMNGMLASMEESGGEFFISDKPLGAWAKEFARTDEGKRYIPARGGSGTGIQPTTPVRHNHEPGSMAAYKDKLKTELHSALTQQV